MSSDSHQLKASSELKSPGIIPGQRLQLAVEDIAFGGEGVCRWHDFVLFVPFVLPGEEVEVEVTEVKKRFARARLVRISKASADRVEPRCRYFGDCGGCQYQHLSYERQLAVKHKQVRDLFARVGGFDPACVAPVLPCPAPYAYRNRLLIRSQWNKPAQKLNIGFLGADKRFVVDLDRCEIAEPALNEQIRAVRQAPPPKGGLKVSLRIMPDDWEVPPDSFFQTNFFMLQQLVDVARRMITASGNRHLIDAYCGVGFFSLELAGMLEAFLGVEVDQPGIAAAKRNAARRQITNGEFIEGAAEELLPGLLDRFPPGTTTVLVDPPRKGCLPEALEQLRRAAPAQLIYVSCHPATQARDLNILCRDDVFVLKEVAPLDMFPQTQHIECIADLRRGSGENSAAAVPTDIGQG